jgi:hypothetical protein
MLSLIEAPFITPFINFLFPGHFYSEKWWLSLIIAVNFALWEALTGEINSSPLSFCGLLPRLE